MLKTYHDVSYDDGVDLDGLVATVPALAAT